ncbi:enoyl-CoA hydratase [Ramlibacter sp. AN1133]|uniref:enoyl-CoA hydratase n=1 Tax=Ramlibacter sp. AN1133 TaxID=3133429 RepID=UPI0030C57CE9
MSEAALLEDRDARGVVTLTMNRPASFNALSEEMIAALQSALERLGDDEGVRAVVLAANGKAFCAGHNLKEMIARPELAYYQELFAQCSRMMLAIQQLPVPVIARVHGIATAAGCQLVAQCDLAVASTEARFAVSGVNYGLFCSTPSVPLLRNVPAKQAMEMLVTGEFISAEQASARGLVNHAVAPGEVDGQIARLVDSILAKPRLALAMGKDLFYRQREMGIAAAYQLAAQTMAANMMDSCALEGVTAFTEKRKPSWTP